MKKRILVTGGAGFLGSHLCEYLLSIGNEVICIDNLLTASKDNIKPFLDDKDFNFLLHDITIPFTIYSDEIYNLACPASPIHYQKNPINTIKTNVLGTINVLEMAKLSGASVLQASTSEIYGDPLIHPQVESYWGNVNSFGDRSCYDEGKRVAESLFYDYCKSYNVDIRVARIFNSYGPKMCINDGRVVSNFIIQALTDEDITIYGDGSQTRSFSYVSDTVIGLISLMDSGFRKPINIGNPNEFTIKQLAEKIINLIGSKSKLVYKSLPSDDPCQRKPDISKAIEILGWEPKVQLEEGLEKTIRYFKSII